jgi:hypothetical protein
MSAIEKGQKAKHDFVNASGAVEVGTGSEARGVTIEEAVAYQYTDTDTGEQILMSLPEGVATGSRTATGWLFGIKTKAINTASAARQNRSKGDATESDIEAIRQWFAEDFKDGQWTAPTEGPRGPRIDLESFEAALMAFLTAKGYQPEQIESAKVRLASDETAGPEVKRPVGLEYARMSLKNPELAAAYQKLRGKATPEADAMV